MAEDRLPSSRCMEGLFGPAGKWARRQKRVRDAETGPRAEKTANTRKVHFFIYTAQPEMCSANKAGRAKSRCVNLTHGQFVPQGLAHTGKAYTGLW